MLTIIIPGDEYYDEINEVFLTRGDVKIDLEHSLAALSKWESIYEKPFLSKETKTDDEVIAYVEAMILTPNFSPEDLERLTDAHLNQINDYINTKRSATWFGEESSRPSREIITSELIYYWMVSMDIPFECQYWHLNRLFTLIRVINVKNAKPKKMSRSEIAERNRALNQQRRAQLGTRG